MNILQLAAKMALRGIRIDTVPDHWRCAKSGCESAEPHVHEERGDDGVWHCVGGTVVATGSDMHGAYQRWYQLRYLEAA